MDGRQSQKFTLFILVFVLCVSGLVFIFSASSIPAYQKYNDMFHYLKRQSSGILLGILGGIIIYRTPTQILSRLTPYVFLSVTTLLILTLVPGISKTVNGASRWIQIFSFSIQPAELAKLAAILYVAKNMSRNGFSGLNTTSGFVSTVLPLILMSAILIVQPDFGSPFLIFCILGSMMFVAGLSWKIMMAAFTCCVAVIIGAIAYAPYRIARITSFLDPWESMQSSGFQIIQSYLGFYNGGLTGLGIGSSRQKLYFLPEAHTDFILSVIGEELGLFGLIIMIILFCYLVRTCIKITAAQRENFTKLLAFGITSWIALQTALNMGVAMGLLPTKGMTLPFLSYGPSSLIVFMWSIAIMGRIEFETRNKKYEASRG